MEVGADRGAAEPLDQYLLYFYGGESRSRSGFGDLSIAVDADPCRIGIFIYGPMREEVLSLCWEDIALVNGRGHGRIQDYVPDKCAGNH